MNLKQFNQLSSDLQSLAKIIPLNWGAIQNDKTDNNLDMFAIHTFIELENKISLFPEPSKTYFRRRWFLWKCAQCDEYLFNLNGNVSQNPNQKSQTYDIEFNSDLELRFDVKGTVIPRNFRDKINLMMDDPSEMIRFFYDNQSKGIRNGIQNRLFIIHHSYKNEAREMYLRCHWDLKKEIYKSYASQITRTSNFVNYKEVKADVIFIFENADHTFTPHFYGIR
ncbi:hypothetical protein [Flavobacterium sp.]|uniref:hypothetical protein n=1 Tax=Flavobacterium sp. TaxID=239 RepID=UPI00286E86F0|nr:hypothetical protein [Flavobacterium sp.]